MKLKRQRVLDEARFVGYGMRIRATNYIAIYIVFGDDKKIGRKFTILSASA